MNKHKLILFLSESVLLCMLIVDSFIRDIVSRNFLTGVIGVLFVVLLVYFRFEPEDKRYLNDAMYTVIIIGASYYIAIYLFGLIAGFYLNNNNLTFFGIFRNVLQAALYIVAVELFRYIVVSSERKSLLIKTLLVITLTLCDISDNLYGCNFTDISDTINLVGFYLIPSLMKNMALTFIAARIGYKPAILYRFIFELPVYFVPIIPSLGEYVQTVFNMVVPIILFSYFYYSFSFGNSKVRFLDRKNHWVLKVVKYVAIVFIACFVALVSGFFKYHLVVIGSGSMSPEIEKGDGAIIEKLDKNEIRNLKVGDILAFKNSGVVIVHRITKITDTGDGLNFRTKGDYNSDEDVFTTLEEDVIGTVKSKFSKIGLPTIWLRELSNF